MPHAVNEDRTKVEHTTLSTSALFGYDNRGYEVPGDSNLVVFAP
jgi:hypothetical protein